MTRLDNDLTYIDLNSDLGEMHDADSVQRDIAILSLVSSANIACGGHAGNENSMIEMVRHAKRHNVRIGAHPSYPDPENFGRKSMDIDHNILQRSLHDQINVLIKVAQDQDTKISYVKPHGALYNDAADDEALSSLIVNCVRDIDPAFAIMGLAGSKLEHICNASGATFIAEAFIDRRYTSLARLQSRSIEGAVITDIELQEKQALALTKNQNIISADGKDIEINAQSLCIHSDSANALFSAKKIHQMLINNDIIIAAKHDHDQR